MTTHYTIHFAMAILTYHYTTTHSNYTTTHHTYYTHYTHYIITHYYSFIYNISAFSL